MQYPYNNHLRILNGGGLPLDARIATQADLLARTAARLSRETLTEVHVLRT